MDSDIVIGWHFLAEDGTSHNGYRLAGRRVGANHRRPRALQARLPRLAAAH